MRRAAGRSILDCPYLYHPLSSSLPGALGLRAWLLGGSGELRRPRRQQPGCLKSFYAGSKRSSGSGLASPCGQAGPGGQPAFALSRARVAGGLAAPRRGAGRAAGRPPGGIRVSGAVGGLREPRREFCLGSQAARHSPGPLFLPADPRPTGRRPQPWSPSPTNCSSSCPS